MPESQTNSEMRRNNNDNGNNNNNNNGINNPCELQLPNLLTHKNVNFDKFR